MREEGEGIPRMFKEMDDSILHPPRFSVENAAFSVTLLNEPLFEGAALEWKIIVDGLDLQVNQKRALLAHPGGFSNEDYRDLSKLDRDQAYREISEMVTSNVLQPPASAGRGAFYDIAPKLRKRFAWLAERLPKLRGFFNEHLEMKNYDYRELFEITRGQATRELRRLVDEGALEGRGKRKGRVYLPGTWFHGSG